MSLGLLAACGSGPPAGDVPVSGESRHILDPGLKSTDRIETFDFVVDEEDSLHAVWTAALQASEDVLPEYHTFYARGRQEGSAWTSPEVLDDEPSPSLRVLTAGHRVHVLSGLRIRHHLSEDRGRSWRDLGEILTAPAGATLRFDAAIVDGELALVVLVHVPPALAASAEPQQELYFSRASNPGNWPLRHLASFPPSEFDPPAPKLVSDGETLFVFAGLNAEDRVSGGSRGDAVGQAARLFSLRSDDRGGSWTGPLELDLGGSGSRPARLQRIEEIDALATADGQLVLLSAHGIYALRSNPRGDFSPPQRINPYETTWSKGSAESSSVSAISRGDHGCVFWADSRYRRTNRTWSNPLGGFPWSDADPYWANNDLFSLDYMEISEITEKGNTHQPKRWTPPMSFIRTARARASAAGWYVAWAGRTGIAGQLAESEDPPRIFLTYLPAEEMP